jgi:hypothetical protein
MRSVTLGTWTSELTDDSGSVGGSLNLSAGMLRRSTYGTLGGLLEI